MKKANLLKRLLSLFLVAAMCLSFLPSVSLAAGEDVSSATWTKVTEAPDDWSGTYLLVYEASATEGVVFKSSLDSGSIDKSGNKFEVEIKDGTIDVDNTDAITIVKSGDGYLLKTASGLYVYSTSDANKLNTSSSEDTAKGYPLSIAMTADGMVDIVGSSGTHLRYNKATNNGEWFRFFKSGTYTNQQAVTLYKQGKSGGSTTPDPVEPEPSNLYKPANGDKVVIYNAANGKVMTGDKGAKGFNGGDATVANGKLTAEAAMELTVKVEGDVYTFTTTDGKYLTSAATGNGMTLEAAASDYSTWQLREQTDGWYIVSVNAQYQGKEQALEYYSNQFYAYTLNSGGSAYLMTFYKDYELAGGTVDPDPGPGEDTGAGVVINQAYGGGGNSGATYKNDFIELYNPTDKDVSLDGWSVQYASATGGFSGKTELSGTIKAHGYYLIQEAAGNGGTEDLPTPDATGTIAMSGTAFKIALVKGTATISGKDDATVVDFVGAGSNANAYEGSGPAPAPSNTNAIIRVTDGVDTGDNKADFKTAAPNPRNSGSTAEPEPTPGDDGIKDGTYVIWAPAYNMALSSNYDGFYNKGVTVSESDGKLSGYEPSEVWTVTKQADGTYTISFGGQNLGLQADHSSMSLGAVNDRWGLVKNDDGTYYVKNTVRGLYIEWYTAKNNWSAYGTINSGSEGLFALRFTPVEAAGEEPGPSEPENTYKPANGDKVVIFYPGESKVMTSTASGTRLAGAAATVSGGKLYTDGTEQILIVSIDSDGYYTFTTEDGKVLNTGASGNNLTLVDPSAAVCAKWSVEPVEGGWLIRSTGANYNGNYNQSIEYYSGNFTTYGYTAGNTIFTMQFYKDTDIRGAYKYADAVDGIAQWGGGGDYSGYADHRIPGDLFNTNDMLDKNAYFVAVVNGAAINPVPDGQSPYMGGKGIGSGKDDYMQFELSTAGYGKMTMAFRLWFTNSSPSQFQLQYSTDGRNFYNFTTGSYHYSYTNYGSDGSQTPVVADGGISDGTAACKRASQYIEYTFDVPASAENAEKLYIRFTPSTVSANGGTISNANNVRIDSVVIEGSPIVDDSITGFVAADPNGEEDQAVGTQITLNTATAGAKVYYRFMKKTGEEVSAWTVYSADKKPVLPSLPIVLEVYAELDGKANSITRRYVYEAGTVQAVKVDPNGGGVYLEGDTAEVTLSCGTEGATIRFIRYDGARPDEPKWEEYKAPIVLKKGFGSTTVEAYATKDGFADSAVVTRTFTERSKARYDIYFGQLHSHTTYSDGAGSAEEAFKHVTGLSDAWNVDFLAVTDHSNSFDNTNSANINDGSVSDEWKEGKGLASQYTSDTFVGIFGYEMTWSNGLGHMNTFNTGGFQSRTQSDYSTYATALQNYYATLKTAGNSLSQFNHPGTTFGDFSDFAYYDEQIDALITLIEVGNGEGQIGSSGYFPSYEYYTRALDKGWHVAPTNNQDNHKGRWGDSNTGRSVVLADELTEEAIYDAMRNYRVYATEDLNLEIYYTFDGVIMGTVLDESSYGAGDKATISVELRDIDDTGLAKVEVIVNGGLSLMSTTATCNETVTFEVPTTYNYYYIKITQADGNIAVTAPVWLGQVEAVGITSLTAESALTVENQEQTFTMELYNNESKALEISSITFTDKATGKVLHTATDITSVPKLSTATTSFNYTFTTDGIVTITATVKGVLNGVEKVYTQDLEITVMPAKVVTKIIVDGTHYNDYVTGYYGGNMNNMTTIAANNGVEVTVVKDQITEAMLKNCSLLIVSAPARQTGTANAGDYTEKPFEDEFIAMVASYVKNGGNVIITGLADYQDRNASAPSSHAAAQQNKLLAAIGSSMTINDDEAYDMERNGGQAYRLYPAVFNMDSRWTKGIVTDDNLPEGYTEGQVYSQYSGATVNPGKGTALVMGFESTFSVDSDKDKANEAHGTVQDGNYNYDIVTPKGEAVFLAYEEVGTGKVFVAGGVFMSDFEVSVELDNIWDLPYANRTIYENILNNICATDEVTPIAETRKADLNKVFVIEGYVTNGTANPNTTFFDAIYVQDSTGGTTCFPYSVEGLKIGTKVRILGYTDAYQDDREIQIISLRVLDDAPHVYQPNKLTTEQAADYDKFGGQLVQTSGKVSRVVMAGDRVSQFDLTDGTGVTATVFIDGYIWNEAGKDSVTNWLKEGQTVSAVGLLYKHPEGDSDVSVPVLRVRNCDEITKLADAMEPESSNTGDSFKLGIWITLMVLAAATVVTLLVLRKKTTR